MLYFSQTSAQSHVTGWMKRARLQRLGWGLVTQLREPSSEESWPQKVLRAAPAASWASWVLPGPAALDPRCPGMAVSGQFSHGDKITLESGPLRVVFTRLHMTVMRVYHWKFEILSTYGTWKSVLSFANRHVSIFIWWQIDLFGDYYLKCKFHGLKDQDIFHF